MRKGRTLAGKYRLVAKLTEGGMSMVWRAEHIELRTPAAVKLLDPTIAESSEALARFKREAQSAASLRCTNIVQIFDFGVDENLPYIAMELLRGKSLADKLRTDRLLSPAETAGILSQVARAAAWAHSRGIVHRDLKPGNIFLSEDADDIVVKLLDFGIAKPMQLDLSETPVTLTGAIMGTPQYMSPEQAAGKKQVDHRTDIWSFGIIAFECLLGRHAFHADNLGGLVLAICTEPLPKPSTFGEVPEGFDDWFARAAHRNAEDRFATIAEAADMLRFICGVEVTSTNRVPNFDGTLPGEVRPIATPSRGIPSNAVDLRRSTDSAATTTLSNFLHPRSRRAQALLIIGVFVVAAAAVSSLLRLSGASRGVANANTATSSDALHTRQDSAPHTLSRPAPTPTTMPSIQVAAANETPEARLVASAKKTGTVGKPTGPRELTPANKQPDLPNLSPTASVSVVPQPPPAAPIRTKCDQRTKDEIGLCPVDGK
jgi:serine/threonine-protein kinase